MICSNCQSYYVRDPCPTCGADSRSDVKSNQSKQDEPSQSVKPSEIRQREATTQVLVHEETLVKPSQRLKQEQKEDDNRPSFQRFADGQSGDSEILVKPSERLRQNRDEEDIPSFQRFNRESTTKPSSRVSTINKKDKDEENIPSFQRYQPDAEVDVSNISRLNKPDQQDKLKNDKEYRNKVKETLEEVMGLLEKLIEDD